MSEEEDTPSAFAQLTQQEPEWSWPPPAVEPFDPSEVPEVHSFFWRASTTSKVAAYVLVVALVTLAGIATATARDQFFSIDAEKKPATNAPSTSP